MTINLGRELSKTTFVSIFLASACVWLSEGVCDVQKASRVFIPECSLGDEKWGKNFAMTTAMKVINISNKGKDDAVSSKSYDWEWEVSNSAIKLQNKRMFCFVPAGSSVECCVALR